MEFPRLDATQIFDYIFINGFGNYEKKQGKWVSRNHKIEFMIMVEGCVKLHIPECVINSEDDLHKYLRIKDYIPSSGDGGAFSWCMCSHDINNICTAEIYFGDTIYRKIQIGCVCIHKIGNKILSDQLDYQIKKYEGKICKNCDEIVNGNVSCLTTHGLCQECYNDKFNRCKNCNEIVKNPKIKSFTELKVCKICYPNEKIKIKTDLIDFIGDSILFKSGKNGNKRLYKIYEEPDGLYQLVNYLLWDELDYEKKCMITKFLQEQISDESKINRQLKLKNLPLLTFICTDCDNSGLIECPNEVDEVDISHLVGNDYIYCDCKFGKSLKIKELNIKPEDYIMTSGKYSGKPLSYIFDPDEADNLQLLIYLVKTDNYAKDNIILFLKQMFQNNIYSENIKNEFINNNLPLILIL